MIIKILYVKGTLDGIILFCILNERNLTVLIKLTPSESYYVLELANSPICNTCALIRP